MKGLFARAGERLYERFLARIRESRAYRALKGVGSREAIAARAATETIRSYAEEGVVPRRYALAAREDGGARLLSWRERRELARLAGLLVRTRPEEEALAALEERLAITPVQGVLAAFRQRLISDPLAALERLAVSATRRAYEGLGDSKKAREEAARRLGFSTDQLTLHLRGFTTNYTTAYEGSEEPLPFFDRELLPKPSSYEELLRGMRSAGLAPAERERLLTREYGMEAGGAAETLEERVVTHYNGCAKAYARGEKGAWGRVAERGARSLEITTSEYREALRRHVSGWDGRGVLLERFDKRLLSDYESYAAGVASLYEEGVALREIAERQARKYGMRISTSSVSRIARDHLRRHGREWPRPRRKARVCPESLS